MPQQPILPHLPHTAELIPQHTREYPRPKHPVQEPNTKHRPARDGLRPLRQRRVRVRARVWADEQDDEEEDIHCAEEERGDECGAFTRGQSGYGWKARYMTPKGW